MTWFKLYDNRWDKTKAAFRRDWEQTRHDLGSDSARDLKQDAGNTLSQILGDDPIPVGSFERLEPAFRYGYAAGAHHDQPWSADLDRLLAEDYPGDWDHDSGYVHYAYLYYQRTEPLYDPPLTTCGPREFRAARFLTKGETMTEIEKFVDLLNDFRFCMMTTEGADGRWHTRPMTLQDPTEDRAIWFVAVRDSKSAANLRHSHRLQLSFLRSSDGAWISIWGRAELDDKVEHLRQLWKDNWDIWFDEADKFERAVLVNVEPIQIEFWEPKKGRFHQFADMIKARYSDSSITFDESVHRLRVSAQDLAEAAR